MNLTSHRRAFTLIELLVVIAIIAILAAILFPVFAQARDKARSAACLSNVKQIATGLYLYTQDYDEILPHHPADVANFLAPTAGPNWAKGMMPYVKNEQILNCPSAPPDPRQPSNPASRSSYQGNAVLLSRTGTPLARIPNPADIVFAQEIFFSLFTIFNRPQQVSLNPPLFRHWHLVDCRTVFSGLPQVLPGCGEQYNSRHFEGGNIVFADGHAKYRKFRTMRSSDFGLLPDEAYRADLQQSFCPVTGACAGTNYAPAF